MVLLETLRITGRSIDERNNAGFRGSLMRDVPLHGSGSGREGGKRRSGDHCPIRRRDPNALTSPRGGGRMQQLEEAAAY